VLYQLSYTPKTLFSLASEEIGAPKYQPPYVRHRRPYELPAGNTKVPVDTDAPTGRGIYRRRSTESRGDFTGFFLKIPALTALILREDLSDDARTDGTAAFTDGEA